MAIFNLLHREFNEEDEFHTYSTRFVFKEGVLRQVFDVGHFSQVQDTYTDYWYKSKKLWNKEGHLHNSKQVSDCLVGLKEFLSEISNLRSILDLGCASGLTSKYVLDLFPDTRHWAGVDFNPAIFEAESNLSDFTCSREYVFGDLLSHPYESEVDLVVCNAVLHHLPSPLEGLKAVHKALTKSGKAVGWVCSDVPIGRQETRKAIHQYIDNLPFQQALEALRGLSELGATLGAIHQTIHIDRDIAIAEIKAGTYTVHEFINRHFLKCFYSENCSLEMADLFNYDEYKPSFQHRLTHGQWRKLAEQAGFSNVNVLKTTNSGFTLYLTK